MPFKDQIKNLAFDYGTVDKIQSSYIEISMYNKEKFEKSRITFVEKRDLKIKLNDRFSKMEVHSEHIINLETREPFYEIYFSPIAKDSFNILLEDFKKLINDLYLPFKSYKNFLNPFYLQNTTLDEYVSGKLGIAPDRILKEILKLTDSKTKLTNFPNSNIWNSPGKVLTFGEKFIWCKDFYIEAI